MKIKVVVSIFLLSIFFIETTYGQENDVRARLIICTELSDNNVPLNNLEEIKIKEGDKVYFYVKWFNLSKKNHTTSIDVLSEENNYLVQSSEYKFKPKKRTHNSWNSRKFRRVFIPKGVVKIRVILDKKIILEQKVSVEYIE